MRVDRRAFLATAVGAVAARPIHAARPQGLETFSGDTLPCVLDVTATPAVSPGATYKAGAPLRTAIADGQRGTPLDLGGVVAGLSCGPIDGASLEFWQPDAGGAYDMAGFNLRGRQMTGPGGRYRLSTILPGAPRGQAPVIHVHVVVGRKVELWTALFLPGRPANAGDPRFHEALVLKLAGSPQHPTATFDIRVDL